MGEEKKDERIKNERAHLIHEPGDYSDYGGPRQSYRLTRREMSLGTSPRSSAGTFNFAETLQTRITLTYFSLSEYDDENKVSFSGSAVQCAD